MTVVRWKTFGLTHVDYPEDDLFGKGLAILSLTPLVTVVVFITFFAVKRDLHTFFYGAGIIVNGILNYFLKHTIRQARPITKARSNLQIWEEFGMPSSHSQFVWFVNSYLVLFVVLRLHYTNSVFETVWKSICLLSVTVCSVLVSYGRIYLEFHSTSQVLVGSVVGAICGVLWFVLIQYVISPHFSTIAGWRISEFLLIRDTSLIPNILWFEYTTTRAEANNRHKRIRKSKNQ